MKSMPWGVVAAMVLAALVLLMIGAGAGDTFRGVIQRSERAPSAQSPATYYVRPDGGSATQCTGLVDAAYPGSGTAQPCAWDHPFRALPPGSTPRISGGDTLIVGAGSYRMGYGAPGADTCDAAGAFDCTMPPVPSGPGPATPTRILGQGWENGCTNPPELWGAERPWYLLNLTGSSNVALACLELTDHSGCVEFHTGGLACERDTPPYGDWAATGIYAGDSANVRLQDLNIHGLAAAGIHAGRLTDWTVENVRIAGNGWVGWDGDIDGGDSNAGTLLFRRWTVEWNGCGETYPGQQPTGCWGQTAGGYGDGVGTGATGGHWIIEDSTFSHNTSDGLDLLYARLAGSSIEIRRTIAEGNAGNQLKTNGPTLIENAIVVGNCGFFDGQPFTSSVDNCRAAGNALSLALQPGDQVTVTNSTLTSEGDCLVLAECEGTCNGSESVRLRNNIFVGQTDFLQPFENSCLVYQETFPADPFDSDFSVITATKGTPPCPGAHDLCDISPGLVNSTTDAFDAHLLASSPAIDAGTGVGAPSDDFDGRLRDAAPDIGAYEYGPCTLSQDVNGDGEVNAVDLQVVTSAWLTSAPPASADRDGDGDVDVVDIMLVAAEWGERCL
ncbi:MAG: right-handed parallel beta-helix repeat-containing protein [Ardenticatenaceae bacterium]|nr:right-handed parallel beta-helix repeat-containing protein [Ardenticatenaceae bacterium]